MSTLLLLVNLYASAAALFCPFITLAWWGLWRRHQRANALLTECAEHFTRCPLVSSNAATAASESP